LTLPKNMHVRNKAVILFLLPITIFLWIIGWNLFWTGSQTRPLTTKAAAETNPPITTGILLENYEEYST